MTRPDPPAGGPAGEDPAAVLLDRQDADGWADTLRHAGSLLWHLAGDPTAEHRNAYLSERTAPGLAELGLDLLAMADQLSEHATEIPGEDA